jgi:hypothetical protein
MSIERNYRARSTAAIFSGLMLAGITALLAALLKNADRWAVLRWGTVYFACLIAPALTSWVTWRRLTRYMPFVPREVRRVLLDAAGTYVLLGFFALLFVLSILTR